MEASKIADGILVKMNDDEALRIKTALESVRVVDDGAPEEVDSLYDLRNTMAPLLYTEHEKWLAFQKRVMVVLETSRMTSDAGTSAALVVEAFKKDIAGMSL